jgi:hypothetical protein
VAENPWFENQEGWNCFYEDVDTLLESIHQQWPLFAIFFQDGQFFGKRPGRKLTELEDKLLIELFEKSAS